ncbi:MAG: hypothetical protein ACP5HM_14635 [Anaerolineae bacterium]
MQQKKHICGYPIWIEEGREIRFWDAPEGRVITRCPGCGGRLVLGDLKSAETMSSHDSQVLGPVLAELVERVEATLYQLQPEATPRWDELTREARKALTEAGFDLPSPPWASTLD